MNREDKIYTALWIILAMGLIFCAGMYTTHQQCVIGEETQVRISYDGTQYLFKVQRSNDSIRLVPVVDSTKDSL